MAAYRAACSSHLEAGLGYSDHILIECGSLNGVISVNPWHWSWVSNPLKYKIEASALFTSSSFTLTKKLSLSSRAHVLARARDCFDESTLVGDDDLRRFFFFFLFFSLSSFLEASLSGESRCFLLPCFGMERNSSISEMHIQRTRQLLEPRDRLSKQRY